MTTIPGIAGRRALVTSAGRGIGHVFIVTGGAVAHLIDSVGTQPGID
jgi:hypothetical protein